MRAGRTRQRRWVSLIGGTLLVVLLAAALVWSDDIRQTVLDPKVPYQTYDPPPAPDYTQARAWALIPGVSNTGSGTPSSDVFFVHPTTYDGGREWNAPIGHRDAAQVLSRAVLPNYAGPYQQFARVFAPRYRQASLYTLLTLRDDARDARAFAYRDVREAFRIYLERHNEGRPFLVVGVEQGGLLAARLIGEEILPNPALQFAGAHLVETAVPVGALPACTARNQAGCVLAWLSVPEGEDAAARRLLERAVVWRGDGLENLDGRAPLCVNPLLGRATSQAAPAALHHGGANASGLEWGLRPAMLKRQVAARCIDGLLRTSLPESPSLRRAGSWAERRRVPAYNLFYADLEADARARIAALLNPPPDPFPGASRTAPPAL